MAEKDGKLYITISDDRISSGSGGGGTGGTTTTTTTTDNETNEKEPSIIGHYVRNFIISEAKQMASYSINNIGNFTGNYQEQRQIEQVLGIGGKLATITMATATYGIAGFVISAGSLAINEALQRKSEIIANQKANHEIEQLRKLSGLDNLTNGSR